MPTPTPTAEPRPRLTDSPWFWAYLFSAAAFVALLLMGGKYEHRQTHIEDEFRYGTRTLHRSDGTTLSDNTAHGDSSADKATTDDAPDRAPLAAGPQPPTHEMLISLGPLRAITGVTMVVSCIALQWSYLRRRAKAKQ